MPMFYQGRGSYSPTVEIQPKPHNNALGTLVGAGVGFLVGGPAGALRGAQVGMASSQGGLGAGVEAYIGGRAADKAAGFAAEDRAAAQTSRELEDAWRRTQLREHGVTVGGDLGSAIAGHKTGATFNPPQFGANGLGDPMQAAPSMIGLNAPGSFNPRTGGFNPPMTGPGRPQMDYRPGDSPSGGEALGGGAMYRPGTSLTDRAAASERQSTEEKIAAMIAAGVPPEHARAEVLGGIGTNLAKHLDPTSDAMGAERYAQELALRRASAANAAGNRAGADTRRDLGVVQQQVAGARSDLNKYDQGKPKRSPAADQIPSMAQRYTADSTTFERGRAPRQQRYDSLVGVQDRLAAALQAGGPGPAQERTDTAGMAARARELASKPGATRAQIIAKMKAEGWPIADN